MLRRPRVTRHRILSVASSSVFEDSHAVALAEALEEILEQPGWYADFHNDEEIFVVFPRKIFRYPRGDEAQRSEAQAHGRELGIPEPQLDWAD